MARTLTQWIAYIQTLHPRTIDLSLERAAAVWEKFKPAELPPVVAVAGTNGKGSSVSMLESVYRQAGYQTGAFTSPHLVRFNERISLNNLPVSDEILLQAFNEIECLRGDIRLTFFEFNTLLALKIFCQFELDVLLLEIGMGGRLDAVNIVNNDLALITAIGIDHSAWLGDTREKIGAEKAGIIKPAGRAVVADPQSPDSIARVARQQKANTVQAGDDYTLEADQTGELKFKSAHSSLKCYDDIVIHAELTHQQYNAAGVIAAVAMLNSRLPVSRSQLNAGFKKQTLGARLQLIEGAPLILLDVSHNEASIFAMIDFIDKLPIKGKLHAIFGALADKRYNTAFEQLQRRVDVWYLATLEGERGQSAQDLSDKLFSGAQKEAIDYCLFETPIAAYKLAKKIAKKRDLIVIFGSFHLVGAIIPSIEI